MEWYLAVLRKYAVFSGRARRKEFWMFVLVNFIISLGLGVISIVIKDKNNILGMLYSLAVFLPSLAVSVRRLHDTGRSGWWLLIGFIPIIGWIALLIFYIMDSQPGENKYGPNPKEQAALFDSESF